MEGEALVELELGCVLMLPDAAALGGGGREREGTLIIPMLLYLPKFIRKAY